MRYRDIASAGKKGDHWVGHLALATADMRYRIGGEERGTGWTLGVCDRRSLISQYRIGGGRMGYVLHECESAGLRRENGLEGKGK